MTERTTRNLGGTANTHTHRGCLAAARPRTKGIGSAWASSFCRAQHSTPAPPHLCPWLWGCPQGSVPFGVEMKMPGNSGGPSTSRAHVGGGGLEGGRPPCGSHTTAHLPAAVPLAAPRDQPASLPAPPPSMSPSRPGRQRGRASSSRRHVRRSGLGRGCRLPSRGCPAATTRVTARTRRGLAREGGERLTCRRGSSRGQAAEGAAAEEKEPGGCQHG